MTLVLSSARIVSGCFSHYFHNSFNFSDPRLTNNSPAGNFRLARAAYGIAQMLVGAFPPKCTIAPEDAWSAGAFPFNVLWLLCFFVAKLQRR
jgi:hypothetical protein